MHDTVLSMCDGQRHRRQRLQFMGERAETLILDDFLQRIHAVSPYAHDLNTLQYIQGIWRRVDTWTGRSVSAEIMRPERAIGICANSLYRSLYLLALLNTLFDILE